MPKRANSDAIDHAIDAGNKACDLYQLALKDLIVHKNLREWFTAALAEYERQKLKSKSRKG